MVEETECVGDKAPARTEDPDNQMNDIAKGGVCTGRDARTVRFVFVSICCGVARLTNIQYLNTPPEARHSQRREQKEKRKDKIENNK